jgi:hypothetical protein
VLPTRLGARFALEALFIILLAVGAGLADLRPAFIVLVMGLAWLIVALVELAADRITRSPISYLLPEADKELEEEEPERVFAPQPVERTVVAPPQALEDTQEPVEEEAEPVPEPAAELSSEPEAAPEVVVVAEAPAGADAQSEADAEAESLELPPRSRFASLLRRSSAAAESEPEAVVEPDTEAEIPAAAEAEQDQPVPRRRLRALLRRREEEPEPIPEPPPRHVKLLPRRPAPEPPPASGEVAELFDSSEDRAAAAEPTPDAEETAG